MAAVLLTAATWAFSSELTWDFSFDAADVELTPRGEYTILSLADGANPRDAIGAPAIPAKFANILLPDGATDVSVAATGDLVLLASDITPYPVQRVAPKSKPLPPFTAPDADAYASADPWPSAVATFEGVHEMQGSTFVSVRVNPLVYVASEKALYYRPTVSVTVSYATPSVAPRSSRSVSQNALATEMVNALVVNPEDADSLSAIRRRAAARASSVDYLIITSSGLSSAFQNLADYRATAAGGAFKTLVITTNEIASSYSGDDIQMKIRNCISNYVKNSGTTYVVLGGDDSVVPDRDCYAYVPDNSDPTYEWHMPTDLYYSDLTGTWKASGNTNFGVRAANVDMSPDVIVGRIPVRNASQLSGYLAKVQAFEADTSHTRNSIIMGGPAAWCRYYGNKRPSDDVTGDGHAAFRASNHTYVSDSEMWNRRLFRDGIYTNWSKVESSITMKIACDSITSWDSSTCGDKALSSSNLKTWLNVGYTHFMFSGHGYPQGWGMETSANYSSTQAAAQTNLVAFVYTDACLTGAFDDDGIGGAGTITVDVSTDPYQYTSEPCLGEAFIRNANGGSLVHMGCARYGWGNPDYQNSDPEDEDSDGYYTNCTASASSDGGPSTVYAYKFYKRLYESAAVSSNRTVGAAFAMSKADMISQCSSDDCERWIQFGLNYLGDPAIALYPRAVPDAAPEFSSSAASTNGCTGESIYFDFSELLVAGSPAPTYTVSTSVSSSLYEWADGILAFTPIATGTYTFTCTAANGISPNATCTLTVTVTPPPPETPSEVAVISSDSFTATWSPVTGASTYELVVLEGAASGGGSGPFSLVTSSSGLTAGEYVILADGIDRAMNNNCNGDSSGVLSYEDVTVDNSTITTDEASIIWTLAGNADSCTLFNAAAGKYVNPATARNVGWSANASGAWTLSLNNGVVTVANAANTSWMLQYNSGSPRFALYDNNNQKKLRFFRRDAGRSLSRAVGDVVYSNSVGNVTNFSVTGLQPDTSYSYSVRAIVDGQPTAWSDSVSVTTTEGDAAPVWSASFPTTGSVTTGQNFEILDVSSYVSGSPTPTVTLTSSSSSDADYDNGYFLFNTLTPGEYPFTFTASNTVGTSNATITVTVSAAPITVPTLMVDDATDTTAYALWDACTGVTSYTLQLASDNQFTTGGSGAAVLEADFSDTSDWTLSGTGTYTGSAYYGQGSPSIKFDGTGDYAISPEFGGGSKLSFWAYGNGSGTASTFAISGLVNGSWTAIETVEIAIGADTYEVNLPSGTTQLRFDFTKNGYNCALDDMVVTGASGSGSLIAEYTVNDTEYTFTGLTPNTTYYARVKGTSDWSNVETFTTLAGADTAPVWSTIPPINVTVGEEIPAFYPANYVSGTPAPTITLSSTTAASGYTFANGTLSFTPASTGSFDFTFTADNGVGSPASATLTVTATGSAPVISGPQTSYTTTLGGADVEFTVTATGAPTPTLALSDTTATSGVTFDENDGSFSFTPYATGDFTFTFTATSLLGSDSVTVTVTVSAAPVTVPTLAVTNITATNALASWTACDGVSSYTLQLSTNEFSAGAATITDTLTAAKLGLGGSYGAGSYASGDSGAEYAAYGMTKSGGTAIQIRSNDSQSGIVVTKSPGSVTEVRVTFESSTASNRTLNVYGSASAYSSAADLYSASTPLGTIVYDGSNATGTYTINGSYAFIGIRSASGAIYLDNVEIDWTPANGGTTSKGLAKDGGDGIQTFTVNDTEYEFTGLAPESTYYARVKGTSDWSNVETFTTLAGADSAPVWSAIPAQNYLFGSNNGTFEFNVAPYASGSPSPAFYLGDTQWTAYVDNGNGDFIFEPEALGTFDFTVIASNTLGTANATLSVTVTAAPPAFVDLPSTVTGYAGEDVAFTVVATGNPAPVLDVDAADGLLFDFNPTTGLFEFNSDNTGDFEFEFTAANIAATVTQTVTVTISAAPVTVPVLTVTNVTDTTALATWTACDGVTEYTLQLSTNDFPAASSAARSRTPILAEDFSGFTANGTTDISGSLNTYTTNSGWTGSKVYCNSGEAKVGASSGQAWLTTPALTVSGSLTVVWKARTYGTSDKYTLLLGISEDGTTFTDTTITLYDDMTVYTNTLEVSGTTAYVRWMNSGTSKARFYLDDVSITTPESGGDDPAEDDIQEFPVAGTSYEFTGLTPFMVYYARVKGNAEWSNVEEFITEDEPVTGTAPSWSALPADASVVVGSPYELDLSTYVSGDAPITFTLAETELEADVVDSNFIFYPAATGTPSFTFTASNAFGTADATLTVTVTGEAPAVIVTPATYSYEVNVGDPYVEFTVTASGHPVPTLSDSCTEGAYYIFENNAFLFDPDTAGTYHFVFTASNSEGEDSKTITVTVTGGDVPLTGYEAWVTGLGLDPAVYPATATGANGHLNSENYICDISPLSTVELELGVTGGQVDLAAGAKSANRSYTLQVWTDLKAAPEETDLGLGATGLPIALDDISATEFMRVKVTIP
ncbi:MAG: hypothetical protein J6Y19_11215 [Kiritimatiellae bacterium]|nr:hypothetical protein [Kiritimatiellia bacterium]